MTAKTKVSSILWSLLRFGQGERQALGLDREIVCIDPPFGRRLRACDTVRKGLVRVNAEAT
jgi:hypothetical protein